MKIGRNDPCPCGSGKKYKKCCFGKSMVKKKDTGRKKQDTGRAAMASSYWIPTREAGEKIPLIQIECALNKPLPDLDGRTPFEDTVIHKNSENFFKIVPHIKESPIFKYYERALPQPEEFSYNSVYSKTGGVLNLFNTGIKESMDAELKNLLDKYPEKEAIGIWKDTPSELWNNLPPKLVWAGGGKIEIELMKDFMKELANAMENRGFESEEIMIAASVSHLRNWSVTPNAISSGAKPIDAIIEERQKIYENKISFLKEMGIETDFA